MPRRKETFDGNGNLIQRREPDNDTENWTIYDGDGNVISTQPFSQRDLDQKAEEEASASEESRAAQLVTDLAAWDGMNTVRRNAATKNALAVLVDLLGQR